MNANLSSLKFVRAAALMGSIIGMLAPIASAAPDPATGLEFTFTAGAWWTRLNGETTLGAGNNAVIVEEALNLNELEVAFAADFSILKQDRWRLGFGGFHFSTEATGEVAGSGQFGTVPLNPGDPFAADFDMTSIYGEFGLYPWQPYCIDDHCRVALRVGPVVGVRHIDIDQTVTVPGAGMETAGGEWLAPFIGAQIEFRYNTPETVPLVRVLQIDGSGGVGPALGGDGGIMAQLHTNITFFFTQNFGLGIGYRVIHLDVENDDYRFNGGLQGLFFSGTVRF